MKKKTVRIALALCGLFFVASNNAKRKKLLSSENVEADQAEPTYELIGQRVQLLYEGGMKAESLLRELDRKRRHDGEPGARLQRKNGDRLSHIYGP